MNKFDCVAQRNQQQTHRPVAIRLLVILADKDAAEHRADAAVHQGVVRLRAEQAVVHPEAEDRVVAASAGLVVATAGLVVATAADAAARVAARITHLRSRPEER